MKRDLFACRTPADRLAWEFKWADILSGRVLALEVPQRPPSPRGYPLRQRVRQG